MDIHNIIYKHGIDLSALKGNAAHQLLNIETFDDSEYEQRTPQDYLSEVLNGSKDGVYGKALCADFQEEIGKVQYLNCIICGFDSKTDE